MVERGRRRLGRTATRRLNRLLDLPATALPLEPKLKRLSDEQLATALLRLGYRGLAHPDLMRPQRPAHNPAQVLLLALGRHHLPVRLAEALPWVVLHYPDLDWRWLTTEARRRDLQNRVGFVVQTARDTASRAGRGDLAAQLDGPLAQLEHSRLAREDTLTYEDMLGVEREWVRSHRPEAAQHWNLLSDMVPEHLVHVL